MSNPSDRDRSLYRIAAGVLAAAVLAQSALAGQFLTTSPGALAAHRVIAESLSLVALVIAALGFRLRRADRDRWWIAIALLLAVIAQTGLGFVGRESSTAAAIHVPMGVAMFGLAIVASLPRLRA